ncbi:fibronectin type III domain-containing protein [Streptomyces lutosisoli]|uniref:Fibronectin type III domain-containing protein n=1 Tax=Streptomyces lutosisoli TaxID=2665721 RepID=A0ABW2VUS1_9ACTN
MSRSSLSGSPAGSTVGSPRGSLSRMARLAALALVLGVGAALSFTAPAHADLPGADTQLTRAPYLSDATTTSVQVNWATTTQSRGSVRYGPLGDCAAQTATSASLGSPITVGSTREYANSVTLTGLSASTGFCYRVYTASGTDLLGTLATPGFTTPDSASSTAPFTFAVLGDTGETTNSGVDDGSVNLNQANVMSRIGSSGARFVLQTGDNTHPGTSQTQYGDLNQSGPDVSSWFGPSYWAQPGMRIPLIGTVGNHSMTATYLSVWKQSALTAASGGVFGMVDYPSYLGSNAISYPTTYYAFTTGGVRFYVLDTAWGNSNTGSATGGSCGSHCAIYEQDAHAHWQSGSAEYAWLKADLAAHPTGPKFAFFHFPLRSDSASEPSDTFLADLEQTLLDGGVDLVFNGHSHLYQRNSAGAGRIVSYVTGGGGADVHSVGENGCSATDAYGIGWSYSRNRGSACGAATAPTDDAQVYHFLKVTVDGTSVTVAPTDSLGQTFDVQTYTVTP